MCIEGVEVENANCRESPQDSDQRSEVMCGCGMMLSSSYYGNRLAHESGRGCSDCCDASHSHRAGPVSAESDSKRSGCSDRGCC